MVPNTEVRTVPVLTMLDGNMVRANDQDVGFVPCFTASEMHTVNVSPFRHSVPLGIEKFRYLQSIYLCAGMEVTR